MSYVKQEWKTGDKITAEKLNHMENGIAEGVQPDYNQNDSSAADFIKNRPFYSETENVVQYNSSSLYIDTDEYPSGIEFDRLVASSDSFTSLEFNEVQYNNLEIKYVTRELVDATIYYPYVGATIDTETGNADWDEYPFYIVLHVTPGVVLHPGDEEDAITGFSVFYDENSFSNPPNIKLHINTSFGYRNNVIESDETFSSYELQESDEFLDVTIGDTLYQNVPVTVGYFCTDVERGDIAPIVGASMDIHGKIDFSEYSFMLVSHGGDLWSLYLPTPENWNEYYEGEVSVKIGDEEPVDVYIYYEPPMVNYPITIDNLTVNQNMNILFNGVEYENVPINFVDGLPALTLGGTFTVDPETTHLICNWGEYPFILMCDGVFERNLPVNVSQLSLTLCPNPELWENVDNFNIAISSVEEVVHKIDSKYLPGSGSLYIPFMPSFEENPYVYTDADCTRLMTSDDLMLTDKWDKLYLSTGGIILFLGLITYAQEVDKFRDSCLVCGSKIISIQISGTTYNITSPAYAIRQTGGGDEIAVIPFI